jgi:hypothetical protein
MYNVVETFLLALVLCNVHLRHFYSESFKLESLLVQRKLARNSLRSNFTKITLRMYGKREGKFQ